ncbi:MAG: flagellar biosynthetic protein FliR [Planctomycetaceae bacterium]|nr:flagellar biosynthetic protein FliR [Planctomycetaceae bacterium]
MFEAINAISGNYLSQWANHLVVESALAYFVTFVLVLLRISGLMLIGPFFAHSSIPQQVKILFAFSLALIVTPALQNIRERGFEKLDINRDGVLTATEIPRPLRESTTIDQAFVQNPDQVLTRSEFLKSQGIPSTLFDLAWMASLELAIGMMLGLGVLIILTCLQMAGESFDQQAGTALSEIFNPALGISVSPTGQLLFLLGTTALLTMPPFDGHLMMLMSVLDTFEVIPLGMTWTDVASLDVLRNLMTRSLALSVQIAAPLLSAMALLSVIMGFLGYTVPQINILVLGFPIRAILSTGILLVTLSGAADVIVDEFSIVLDQLVYSFVAPG